MNWNQINSNEGRRSFTIAFFALVALASLLIGSFNNTDLTVRFGLLIITISSLLLMAFLLITNLKSLGLINENILTGKTRLEVSYEDNQKPQAASFEGDHKPIETVIRFVPDRNKLEERSEEEKILSAELKEILKTGFSPSNCLKGLELLARNESLVKTSWTHTLNKARLLRGVGQSTEAEELTFDVIKRFSKSNEAVGIAYEVLSFIEEFKEPKEKGALYQQWLEKRREYVMKGLEFFPTGHDLLMNAFEVATLQGNAEEVLIYLDRAASVDREHTQENLKINPLTQRAMGLDPKVRKTIIDLVEGGSKMKAFEIFKIKTLILVLAIAATGSLSASILSHKSRGLPYSSVSVQSRSGDGTGVGAAIISFRSKGTGIGNC